jgi:hypothetical protein
MACVDYASDQEWSKYLLCNVICWAALIAFVIADFLSVITNKLTFYLGKR